MISLVGDTGFVGSNLLKAGRDRIEGRYHSSNISQAFGTNPDLLIYAGMRAEKFLANQDAAADLALVHQAEENIRRIAPRRVVLISTIDVLKEPCGCDEDAEIDTDGLHPYGLNRYRLEQWVRDYDPQALIVRLPALYGINLKKNFIYDCIHLIPSMLREDKFLELSARDDTLHRFYTRQDNGFFKCRPLSREETALLKRSFLSLGFTALNFTDSRNVYQFYPLERLWKDLQTAIEHRITLWHPATEPVCAADVYRFLTGKTLENEITAAPVRYDYRTKYAPLFGGTAPYILSAGEVLEDLKKFVDGADER